mmetsp:Transcript_74361/g.177167  ORF Transcript_74361/g.177167 Transcript_74361/m.177167 type:complete len:87 (+) Transcript_74361:145-405(+)
MFVNEGTEELKSLCLQPHKPMPQCTPAILNVVICCKLAETLQTSVCMDLCSGFHLPNPGRKFTNLQVQAQELEQKMCPPPPWGRRS